MSKLHLYFTVSEIARLTGVSTKTVFKELKEWKTNRRDPLDVLRFLYPRIMIAQQSGLHIQKTWRGILEARAASAVRRKAAAERGRKGNILRAWREGSRVNPPLTLDRTEDIPQLSPED